MTDLSTPTGCMEELGEVNQEIAALGHVWAAAAGEHKESELRYQRLHRAGLRGIKGDLRVADKDAAAHAAVEQAEPDLAEKIEELARKVEEYKTLFKALERRSSNAQSLLAAMRDELRGNDWRA